MARAAARRTRKAEDHINVQRVNPMDQFGRAGKGLDHKGEASEQRKEELYRSVRGSDGSEREKESSSVL